MRELFESIKDFAERAWEERASRGQPVDPVTMTERYALRIVKEATELLDEVPWKDHRTYEDTDVIRDNILEETADIIFTAWSNAVRWGATYDELLDAMQTKRSVIEYRWQTEKVGVLVDKVALIDLDGVLCEWVTPFLTFAIGADSTLGGIPNSIFELQELAGPVRYKQLKHAWRQSGQKRYLPPLEENVRACQILADAGYDIVILSNRPAHRYSRITGDTLFWLNRYHVPFKRILFTEDKPLRVALSGFFSAIEFAVDDDPRNVASLRLLGVKTYQPGNDIIALTDIPEVKEAINALRESRSN